MAIGTDQQTSVVTSAPLKAIGWGGLTVALQVRLAASTSRLKSGQMVATVSLGSANMASTGALARNSVSSPSLGWRFGHLF
jgi:Cu/Ag efflux protein CusF